MPDAGLSLSQKPLTPALSRCERELTELSYSIHRPEVVESIMESVKCYQVGVFLKHPPMSPLSLWERVMGFVFQTLN